MCPHDGTFLKNINLLNGFPDAMYGYFKCSNGTTPHVFCGTCYHSERAELYKVTIDGNDDQYYYICASCKFVFCAKCISDGSSSALKLKYDGSIRKHHSNMWEEWV